MVLSSYQGDLTEVILGAQLIAQLRAAALKLPDTIALATPTDNIACFAGDLEEESCAYDDPWEMVDQALNILVGYGKSTVEVAGLIRRGRLGIDGLCNWLEICMNKLCSDAVLLKGKVTHLIDAVALLCRFLIFIYNFICSLLTCKIRNPSDAESVINESLITQPPTISPLNSSPATQNKSKPRKEPKASTISCPGYTLRFPEGQNPIGSYPFGLHLTLMLPWSLLITKDDLVLISDKCTDVGHSDNGSSDIIHPCTECSALHRHNIIMGICHRALDGSHESTPWQYLSFVELHWSLD
jgi:hypothetical protein